MILHAPVRHRQGKWFMRALWIALMLVSVPGGVLAQSVQDWRLCRAVDADHLVIPACARLIEQNKLSQGDRAIAYAMRGTAHWRQRDFDEAIADANEAIKINPNLAAAYGTRGAAHGNKGEDDQALADDSKAIELDPNNAPAYSNRGITRGNKGDLDTAIADAYRFRSTAYGRKQNKEAALADYNKAIEMTRRKIQSGDRPLP